MAADDQKPFDTPQALSPDFSGQAPQSSSPSSTPQKGARRKAAGPWLYWLLGLYVLAIIGFVLVYLFMPSIGLVGLIRKGLGGLFFFGLGVTVLTFILKLNVPDLTRRGKAGGGPGDGKAAAASGRRWRISSP